MKYLVLAFALLIFSCQENKEARLQRFLAQGNNMVTQQSFQDAKRYYKEALKLDSCFADAWNNLGTIYFNEKNYTDALNAYNRALECRPDFINAYMNRSNTYYELNAISAAMQDLNVYHKKKGDTSIVFFSRGLILTKMRKYGEAIHSFEIARKMDSTNLETLINLGSVYFYKGSLDSAEMIINKALRLKPEEPNSFNTLALIESERQNYDKAMYWITKALAIRPADAYYKNNRGYIHLMKGELQKALDDINESISEDPYNSWAYRNKGIYYLKVNDLASAIRLLERGEKMDPLMDKINFYLGEALLKKGEKARGCSYLNKSYELNEISTEYLNKRCSKI